MEKIKRHDMWFILIVIVLCVFSISIVYSLLSTTLNISGRAEIKEATWDIKLTEFTDEKMMKEITSTSYTSLKNNLITVGSARVVKNGEISDTLIKGFEWDFKRAGDKVYAFYTVRNNGTIPAVLSEKEFLKPEVVSSTGNLKDINWVDGNLEYEMNFYDVKTGKAVDGEKLCRGQTVILVVSIGVRSDASSFPDSNLTVSNFGGYLLYSQDTNSHC